MIRFLRPGAGSAGVPAEAQGVKGKAGGPARQTCSLEKDRTTCEARALRA